MIYGCSMYLCIDLSLRDEIVLTFFTQDAREQNIYSGRNRELLSCIDRALYDRGETKKDVKGILVVVGAGSFTNTRIAVTVANTWGYAQEIPLLAITEEEKKDLQSCISRLLDQPIGQYISATYSGEPNIGPKKKS